MNDLVIRGYDMYASSVNQTKVRSLLAPVGAVFNLIYNDIAASSSPEEALSTDNLWRELYAKDGSHPSISGSYLAACVLYATITNESPVGLVGVTGPTAAKATALQQMAHEAVFVNASVASNFKEVEGSYSPSDPDVQGLVAEIHDGFVMWPVGIRTPLRRKGKQLQMFFHGDRYVGSFSNGVISWSDGDVWRRIAAGGEAVDFAHFVNKKIRLARRQEIRHTEPTAQVYNVRGSGSQARTSPKRIVHINPRAQHMHPSVGKGKRS